LKSTEGVSPSDYLELAIAVYKDACAKCIADVSDLRDIDTLISRVKEEGISFLTITLPNFCRDFEQALAKERIDPSLFRSFRKNGAIPAFLQGMLGLIFDRETGRINYDEVPIIANDVPTIIDGIRQICLCFKKLELGCTPKREQAAFRSFIEIEQSFSMFSLPKEEHARFLRVSSVLWSNLLRDLRVSELSPRHGPGATAERVSGNQKFRWRLWHDRLEPYFPIIDNGYTISAVESPEFESVTIVSEDNEQPVRVTPVPKTLKGPRIIAIEPCCMQYVQQGIRNALYERIESHPVIGGHVNFRDQSINQKLAMAASKDGRLATIDLSDASDRVPHDLALDMFRSNPDLLEAIDACRSKRAEMPDGTVVSLRKFASMGSALCFPVEAMYFYTICVIALLESRSLPVSVHNCNSVASQIYVYGDDIIVPTDDAMIVLDYLQKYNCKVNRNKTFVTGKFRESCGVDAYDGRLVTPIYVRQLQPENVRQASNVVSWVATANLFYEKGYWTTTRHMRNVIEKIIGPLPCVSRDSSALGRISFLGCRYIEGKNVRWNGRYQRLEIKAWVPVPVYHTDELDGYAALYKTFLKLEDLKNPLASRDVLHLERSARHGAVALKRRWVPTT
jgi:hypothetical protein